MDTIIEKIARSTQLDIRFIGNVLTLFEGGATIPFISRYRKEMTGSMDEVQITGIRDMHLKLMEIEKRRETILRTIAEQGKLSDELKKNIENAETLTELEDLYLPYRPRKKTRAGIAREKGLEPLAVLLMKQKELNLMGKAAEFINKDVPDEEAALQGARDIMAEWI